MLFQFDVAGYQFPDVSDKSWDADWLFVRVQLQYGDHSWSCEDPAVTTFEVQRLAEWLDEVAGHMPVFAAWQHERLSTEISFTEPNIGFEVFNGHPTGKPATVRVYLRSEFLPPFKALLSHFLDDFSAVWVDLSVDESALRSAAESLRDQLKSYPVRVGVG